MAYDIDWRVNIPMLTPTPNVELEKTAVELCLFREVEALESAWGYYQYEQRLSKIGRTNPYDLERAEAQLRETRKVCVLVCRAFDMEFSSVDSQVAT